MKIIGTLLLIASFSVGCGNNSKEETSSELTATRNEKNGYFYVNTLASLHNMKRICGKDSRNYSRENADGCLRTYKNVEVEFSWKKPFGEKKPCWNYNLCKDIKKPKK